ncbi:MAG: VWA domain-containing protein [Pirellulales bacterium]
MTDEQQFDLDDWRDRLMEAALRDALGDAQPPDLSEAILQRARREAAEPAAAHETSPSSLTAKEQTMSGSSNRRGRMWTILAVAASLLVAASLGAYAGYTAGTAREGVRIAATANDVAPSTSDDASTAVRYGDAQPQSRELDSLATTATEEKRDLRAPTETQPTSARLAGAQTRQASPTPLPGRPGLDTSGRVGSDLYIEVPGGGQAGGGGQAQPGEPGAAPYAWYADQRSSGLSSFGTQLQKQSADAGLRFAITDDRLQVEGFGRTRLELEEQLVTEGRGPGEAGDRYDRIVENAFLSVGDHPLSTFSIDVDTAAYANMRKFLREHRTLPPPDAVRIEELVNYFDYTYEGPTDDVPFAAHVEVVGCPWRPEHRLARFAIQGRQLAPENRPDSNLVFLLDVSGSMAPPDKLPLLKRGMQLLAEHMREQDRVAIVVYAGSEGLVLPSTPGSQRDEIISSLESLQSGGSTNGGAGIELAYKIAKENFIKGGVNRVILCTDGDFNVGTTSTAELERMVEEKATEGTFLTVLGFGRGNLNDAMMETISNKGNGNYHYIDGLTEAQKVLVEQMGGTLVTIAKDVKIQIEFNPSKVAGYRLIGYENRILAAEDFNDDKKDAGEIGAGHTVTALYEIVPAGQPVETASVDPLKYQTPASLTDAAETGELMTLKLRYKQPDGDVSSLLEFPVTDGGAAFGQASGDTKFAAAVASFGMLLRGSQYAGNATLDAVAEIAGDGLGDDPHGRRKEFVELVQIAKELMPEPAAETAETTDPADSETEVPAAPATPGGAPATESQPPAPAE